MAKFIKSIKKGMQLKKIIVLIFALYSFSFGAKFDLKPSYNLILNTTQGGATIIDNNSFIVGSSGVVLHKLKDGSKTIIARAVVTSKKDGYANLRFELFDQLKQTALPLPDQHKAAGNPVPFYHSVQSAYGFFRISQHWAADPFFLPQVSLS